MTRRLVRGGGPPTGLLPARMQRVLRSSRELWLAFIVLHLLFLLALLPTIIGGQVLGDLPLYRNWADAGLEYHYWHGLDAEWVYPIGALAPITLAALAGPALYQLCWFLMTTALNGLAVGVLIRWGRDQRGFAAACLWLVFTLLLSPVGLLRLEGITAPMVVMALAVLARRPVVAAALLAAATWIKVWPAAVLLAVLIASRRRVSVLLTGTVVTGMVVAFVLIDGRAKFLAGFVMMQSDRALQLEAPVTTPWVWLAALHKFQTVIYQDLALETREVSGPGTGLMASVMTPIMFLAVVAIAVLIHRALRRGAEPADLILTGALSLVSAFVVFNKVGSPQYMLWLVPVVTVGVTQSWKRWLIPTSLLVAIAALTTLVFPVYYLPLVDGDLFAVSLLTARNALLIVLLIWAVTAVARAGRPRRSSIVSPGRPLASQLRVTRRSAPGAAKPLVPGLWRQASRALVARDDLTTVFGPDPGELVQALNIGTRSSAALEAIANLRILISQRRPRKSPHDGQR